MTIPEFKKTARIIKSVLFELEKQALDNGISPVSPEFEQLADEARLRVLEKTGFTLEGYRTAKELAAPIPREEILASINEVKQDIAEVKKIPVLTKKDVAEIAREIAQEFIKPPQITNQITNKIVKIVEKPQIIKETRIEKVIEEVAYNEKPIQDKLKQLSKRIDEIPLPPDLESLRNEIRQDFSEHFKHNIDILEMPDFRKLAMGLQGQIDSIVTNGSRPSLWSTPTETPDGTITQFTVGTTAPVDVIADGTHYFSGAGYTYSSPFITFDSPPRSSSMGGYVRFR